MCDAGDSQLLRIERSKGEKWLQEHRGRPGEIVELVKDKHA